MTVSTQHPALIPTSGVERISVEPTAEGTSHSPLTFDCLQRLGFNYNAGSGRYSFGPLTIGSFIFLSVEPGTEGATPNTVYLPLTNRVIPPGFSSHATAEQVKQLVHLPTLQSLKDYCDAHQIRGIDFSIIDRRAD